MGAEYNLSLLRNLGIHYIGRIAELQATSDIFRRPLVAAKYYTLIFNFAKF
jgi:hypothetical protein